MTWRKVLGAVVASKRNELWSSDLCWMEVESWLIPVMCISRGEPPTSFGASELRQLTSFENRVQFSSPYPHSDYAIVTELAPYWCPFLVLCNDLHIVGNTPYNFGAMQLWSWLYLWKGGTRTCDLVNGLPCSSQLSYQVIRQLSDQVWVLKANLPGIHSGGEVFQGVLQMYL